jgi:hypothetical protein
MTLSYPSWAVGLRCNEKATGHLHRGETAEKEKICLEKVFIPSPGVDGTKIPELIFLILPSYSFRNTVADYLLASPSKLDYDKPSRRLEISDASKPTIHSLLFFAPCSSKAMRC